MKKTRKLNKKTNFRKSICSPIRGNNKRTCYTTEALFNMKKYWNNSHPDVRIKSNNPSQIWSFLREHMNDICETEKCWLKQQFMKNNIDPALKTHTFAPTAPLTWNKNPNEWLTSIDISKVMVQWEKKHPEYKFIGPSPINFDSKPNNNCVWNELCKFNLDRLIKDGKYKIGIIFNLDPHYKPGSHWTALYIDIHKGLIFYFDSNGDPIPIQVKMLVERIITQGHELEMKFVFNQNHPLQHQYENTECGIYVLYMITQLLSNKKTYKFFVKKRISDKKMENLRLSMFFNKNE